MSDIKRYGVWDKPPREDLVTYADHEAAIEQAYSDGESSGAADWQLKIIEVIERHDTGGIMSPDAEGIMGDLRALTQPQTEIEGKPDGTWYDIPDGGGAATAAGVADADLGLPLTNSTLVEEVVAAVYEACLDRAMGEEDASEVAAVLRGQLTGTRPTPTPYAKAFRERVCPVPEFPGIRKEES